MISLSRIAALQGLSLLIAGAYVQNAMATLAVAYPQYLWPRVGGVATVYYVIDANSDPNATPNIENAIATFNADFAGVIQWVPWTSADGANYVDINLSADNTTGVCEAEEGYQAIPLQPMSGATNCTIGVILHEMGHIIGLWHEQSRSDRATHVKVSYPNVIKGSWGNFQILTDNVQILGPYDYASVMHYIPYAFSSNGLDVIETIPAGVPLAGYEGVPAVSGAPAVPVFDYSAGDKETIMRLYGAAPKNVTVTSNPVGLSVIVDGVTVTTPQTYSWSLFSTHTLAAPSEAQTLSGYILNSNPAVAANFYYTFGTWNNSTSESQTIIVTPGNGSPPFPTTIPQISTYSANFIQLVPYTTPAIYPSGSGTALVSPSPQTYTGISGDYFVARTQATLTATAASDWFFYEFNNAPFWLPGGLGANPKTFAVPDTGSPVDPTAEFSNTAVYAVSITPETFSSGLYLYADGNFYYSPKNFSEYYDSSWTTGSVHTLSVPTFEYPYSVNSRYNLAHWGGNVHSGGSITLSGSKTSYTATVVPQFQPATNFSYPPCGGTASISPVSPTGDGFYPTGQSLSFTATPDPDTGWLFGGWTYDVTADADPTSLTAHGETLVYANFNTAAAPLALTSLKPASAKAGGAALTLELKGTGFAPPPASLVSVNGVYRTVTYVSSTELTVPLTAADIATPGGFQVFVENFPSNWTGCAVFAYQTFLVEGAGAPAAEPVFSPPAGTYSSPQSVKITDALPGATIYYTTNGANPTKASPVYTGPISISNTETLKANATATGYKTSAVAKGTYTITP